MERGVDDYVTAGLYDPGAPGADDRLALLRYLTELGCSIEEMVDADRAGRLFALGGDRLVRPGPARYTFAEAAERAGLPLADAAAACAALGLWQPPEDVRALSDADVDALETWRTLRDRMDREAALGLSRVIGAAAARVAEAGTSLARARVPETSLVETGSEIRTGRAWTELAALVPALGRLLDLAYRRHVDVTRRYFEQMSLAPTAQLVSGIGFVDLAGFTAMSRTLPLEKLSRIVSEFEAVCADAIHHGGGRVVKFLGDGVMYVAPTPALVAGIACHLVAHPRGTDAGLQARAGVAVGEVLTQDGDYFGPPVNLAARLLGIAGAGEVLATREVADVLRSAGWTLAELPEQPLRGFDEPVHPVRIVEPPQS